MKYLIVLISVITHSLFATDNSKYHLSIEVIGKSNSKKMQLDNGTVYLLYENSGGYTDNFGNYGNSHCYGKIKTKEDMIFAANKIIKFGVPNILIKGGHSESKILISELESQLQHSIFKDISRPSIN